MYQLTNVTRIHDFGAETFMALDNLTVTIGDGAFAVVTGDLDAGAWQMLTLMSGDDVADRGTVAFDGRDLAAMDPEERTDFQLRDIASLERSCRMHPTSTAMENIEHGMLCSVIHPEVRADFARAALEDVGLLDRAHVRAAELSHVERRLLSIARAIAKDPLALLAHDPTWGLLPEERTRVARVLTDIHRRTDLTMVIASDDPVITGRTHQLIHLDRGHLRVPIPA